MEQGGGGMKPIRLLKPVGRHDKDDDEKKNNNQKMMVAVHRLGRMRGAIKGWVSEARGGEEDGGGGGGA